MAMSSSRRHVSRTFGCIAYVALAAGTGLSGLTTEPRTERVSVDSAAAQANNHSATPSISADGRFVAFRSAASNLVADDTNGTDDIFVRDRQSGVTERVSVSSLGVQGNAFSGVNGSRLGTSIAISADGRYVAFVSAASNLVPDDAGGGVFVRDRATGQTERVSVGGGFTTVTISADGRYVASDTGFDVFVRDRSTGQTEVLSVSSTGAHANGASAFASISADGRFVAFASAATNLVADDTNGRVDVFIRDRQSGTSELVSVTNDRMQGNLDSGIGGAFGGAPIALSGDGSFVAFVSSSSNLVVDDTNGAADVFVRDRASGTTERISVGSGGEQAVGGCQGPCFSAAISAEGRFVAFEAFGLPEGNGGSIDIFVRDRQTHTTELASVDAAGVLAGQSTASAISAEGRVVAFASSSATLVTGDTNGADDVFVRDRGAAADTEPPVLTVPADITVDATSPDGAMVAFVASAVDNVDGVVAVTCAPESGSVFGVGPTTVTCSATDAAGNRATATFVATVRPFFVSFAMFKVEIEIEPDKIELKALFRLGAASDGIRPASEAVMLRIGTFEVAIPAGSFLHDGDGRFRARRHGDARIRPKDGGFEFRIHLSRDVVPLLGPGAEVSLNVGNDRGSTTALVETR